ncbi:MAG: 2-C-methyl-D-erythritol 4-phosphate cytidylyltransferase [Clostridia bacterium]|nr:2-C-methyl-D-erythritol 4-phosphate cytidylyltransferase [Clostridia bacterium]
MNIALVVAGGAGSRACQSVPKQFLTVNEIPIIIHSLLNIKKSGIYDRTVVVIPDGWQAFIESYCSKYEINLAGVILGGESRFGSILNAVRYLDDKYKDEDVISIMDANRPLIPASVFAENLRVVKAADSDTVVLSAYPCMDSMFKTAENGIQSVDRTEYLLGQCPETACLKLLKEIYFKAEKDVIGDLSAANLAIKYGKHVKAVNGSAKSFKITVQDDLDIFKALLSSGE